MEQPEQPEQQQQMFNYFSENKLQSSHNQFNHHQHQHQHHHLTNISIFTLIILLLSFHTVNSANYFDFDDDFSRKVSLHHLVLKNNFEV